MRRRISSTVLLLVTLVTGLALTGAARAAGEEAELTASVAAARDRAGATGYATRSDLVAVARRHAERMAARGAIYHNPALGTEVTGWTAVGENVGTGPDAASVHEAFMASTSHRDNILDRRFTELGVGTAFDGRGALYVVQVFRLPESAPAQSAPQGPPQSPPPPAPSPAANEPAPAAASAVAPAPAAVAAPAAAAPTAPTARAAARPPVVRARPTPDRVTTGARLAALQSASRTAVGSAIERAVAYAAAVAAVAS